MLALRVYVALGAFLLFSMEPMVGRMLLPHFGGAFHVWTTSLMFFQGVLFLAYAWSHLGAPRVGRAHLVVLVLPVLVLPPVVLEDLGAHGVGALVLALARACALPLFALATTSVTAQSWLAGSDLPGKQSPWWLYATSNAGSLLGLVGYAFVVEPFVGLALQRWVWSAAFGGWVVAGLVAWRATRPVPAGRGRRSGSPDGTGPEPGSGTPAPSGSAAAGGRDQSERLADIPGAAAQSETATAPSSTVSSAAAVRGAPTRGRIAYWIAISASTSALLTAVTSLIALDAGNVPLVWIVPLSVYLLTFVLAFAEPQRVPAAVTRLWPHFAVVALYLFAGGDTGTTWIQVLLHVVAFAVVTLGAHAELYRARPAASHLTLFYLVMSLGGWIGGALVALVAPLVFDGLWEFPVAILVLLGTVLSYRFADVRAWLGAAGVPAIGVTLALLVVIVLQVVRGLEADDGRERLLETDRSFYGIYRVVEVPTEWGPERQLVSGATRHGRQFMDEPYRRDPLSYYHRRGPLGDVMEILRARGRPRTIGAVGLGVGATAAYVEAGETLTFFEIDALDLALAERFFHYLEDCRGRCETVVGDARIELEALAETTDPPRWDLLLVDAFAGDAIPVHLVTREAVELDRRLVADDGYLLFHVSNRYYGLIPVLGRIARELGAPAAYIRRVTDVAVGEDPSEYFVFLPDETAFEALEPLGWRRVDASVVGDTALWTDDHVSTLGALVPDWE